MVKMIDFLVLMYVLVAKVNMNSELVLLIIFTNGWKQIKYQMSSVDIIKISGEKNIAIVEKNNIPIINHL